MWGADVDADTAADAQVAGAGAFSHQQQVRQQEQVDHHHQQAHQQYFQQQYFFQQQQQQQLLWQQQMYFQQMMQNAHPHGSPMTGARCANGEGWAASHVYRSPMLANGEGGAVSQTPATQKVLVKTPSAGGAGAAETPATQQGRVVEGLVVDLACAVRLASMDKGELEATLQQSGVQMPTKTKSGKVQLITLLLTHASEPRGAPTSSAKSGASNARRSPTHSPHDNLLEPQDFESGVDNEKAAARRPNTTKLPIAALDIFALRLGENAEQEELLSTMCVSKACLVSKEWFKTFGHVRLHTKLDSSELTRQAFVRELQRPSSSEILTLRIGSRETWLCSQQRLAKMQAKQRVDLTDTGDLSTQLDWWQSGSDAAWKTFENALYASLRILGQRFDLRKLITLDLGFELRDTKLGTVPLVRIHWIMQSHLMEFSTFCPRLQHLCLPRINDSSFDALLLWKALRTFSVQKSKYWKIPPRTVVASGRIRGIQFASGGGGQGDSAEQAHANVCSFDTLECVAITNEDSFFCASDATRARLCGDMHARVEGDERYVHILFIPSPPSTRCLYFLYPGGRDNSWRTSGRLYVDGLL